MQFKSFDDDLRNSYFEDICEICKSELSDEINLLVDDRMEQNGLLKILQTIGWCDNTIFSPSYDNLVQLLGLWHDWDKIAIIEFDTTRFLVILPKQEVVLDEASFDFREFAMLGFEQNVEQPEWIELKASRGELKILSSFGKLTYLD